MWQIQENKLRFINQLETKNLTSRECDDIDDSVLDCAEVKALCCNNPLIKEKIECDNKIKVLELEKRDFYKEIDNAIYTKGETEKAIETSERAIKNYEDDINYLKSNEIADSDDFKIELNNIQYDERMKAGEALEKIIKNVNASNFNKAEEIGKYKGFTISVLRFNEALGMEYRITVQRKSYSSIEIKQDNYLGNIIKIENVIKNLQKKL